MGLAVNIRSKGYSKNHYTLGTAPGTLELLPPCFFEANQSLTSSTRHQESEAGPCLSYQTPMNPKQDSHC